MYNFPHQINDLRKLHGALGVFARLEKQRGNLDDDAEVGVPMARNGVYTFRDRGMPLREALRAEAAKPPGSQGTRTFARDLRRFFLLAGLLLRGNDGRLSLGELGRRLLRVASTSQDAQQIWRTSLDTVALVDDTGRPSHPYRILKRLVAERPGIEAHKLALSLEARNDSDEEFRRVLQLADAANWVEVLTQLGVTEHRARNATKILPALARQLGELQSRDSRYYPAEPERVLRLRLPRQQRATHPTRRVANRRVVPATIARAPNFGVRPPDEQDISDHTATAEIRHGRLTRHEAMVRRLAGMLHPAYQLYEDPYDTLATKPRSVTILVEAKTLDGTQTDEIAQVRTAFAQLLYYETLSVPLQMREHGLIKVALFERAISEQHITFLEMFEIIVCWFDDDGRLTATGESERSSHQLGLL